MSAAAWATTLSIGDVADGAAHRVEIAGRSICLVNVGGEIHAIDDTCTHEDAQLSAGHVWQDTCEIECPMHDSTFDLRTGWPSNPPATMPVAVHRTRIDGGRILVQL